MIETVELHISNNCTADCVVCSKAHGGSNQHFVTEKVIDKAIERIKELPNNPKIELGGDGDAFLHWQFTDFMKKIRRELPDCKVELFTNGYLMTPGWAREIIGQRLIDSIEIRIDSLDHDVYFQATGLPLAPVLGNISVFAMENMKAGKPVNFGILHLPLIKYADFCRKVLDKEPTYFGRVDQGKLTDEWPAIKHWADQLGITSRVTGISLWAERTDCAQSDYPCPRLPENYPGDMARQIYIYPNGDIGLCGYDDEQDRLLVGTIENDGLADAMGGLMAEAHMNLIRNEGWLCACCVNPRACVMWEYDENGDPVNPAEARKRDGCN